MNTRNPNVSIIIPVYNTAPYLAQCLDSVINQTLKDIEIICVNDGSTDTSAEILQEYSSRDPRIIVITQKNSGLPISRNNAMKIAHGEYIQFLDSDDYIERNCCEKLYKYSKQNNLDMLCFGGVNIDNDTGKHIDAPYYSFTWMPNNFKKVFDKNDIKPFITNLSVSACLTFYNHSFLQNNAITWINKKICYEDNLFFAESILKAKRISILKDKLYLRRIHSMSITQNPASHYRDWLEISKLTIECVHKYADPDIFNQYYRSYTDACYKRWLSLNTGNKHMYVNELRHYLKSLQNKYGKCVNKQIMRSLKWYRIKALFYKRK